jgi:hypothetical protein
LITPTAAPPTIPFGAAAGAGCRTVTRPDARKLIVTREDDNMNEKQDAYVQKMKAKLDEWNADIAKMEAKARQKGAEARQDYEQQIEEMKAKRKSLEEDVDRLRRRGEDAWEDLKAGIDNAADALGEALHSARSRF